MLKGRRKRRMGPSREVVNVFGSSNSDSSNDAKGQINLLPGTSAYKQYYDQKKAEIEKKDANEQRLDEIEVKERTLRSARLRKDELQRAYDTGKKKYRRYMSKDVQVKKIQDVIEDGLGHNISRKDFNDELFDDGISGDEFPREAVKDHKREFDRLKDLPQMDTNGDGIVNKDDSAEMTPGMRRLSRYM